MNISDLTAYIKSSGISSADLITRLANEVDKSGGISGLDTENFASLLSEEAKKLTSESEEDNELEQMQELINSLDKSILGANASLGIDPAVIAGALMTDEDPKEVVEALVNGHLSGIALTDSEDLEDKEKDLGALAQEGMTDKTAETLAQNLETIIAGLGQSLT